MDLQSFQTPMHPKADHNYTVNFQALFDGLGGDTIVGIPTITIDDPDPAPEGLLLTFVMLSDDLQSVIFNARVLGPNQDDDTYKYGGVKVCINVIVTTAGGNTEPQQQLLQVTDQCKL